MLCHWRLSPVSTLQRECSHSIDNHKVYFGNSNIAETASIFRTDFVNGAYTAPVKIVGFTVTTAQNAADGPSLSTNINVAKSLVVVHSRGPGHRRVPRVIVWTETEAPQRMRVHDFATQTIRTVAGNDVGATVCTNGAGTSIAFATMANSRLNVGDGGWLWLSTNSCIRKFLGRQLGRDRLAAGKGPLRAAFFIVSPAFLPSPAGPTRSELMSVTGWQYCGEGKWKQCTLPITWLPDTSGRFLMFQEHPASTRLVSTSTASAKWVDCDISSSSSVDGIDCAAHGRRAQCWNLRSIALHTKYRGVVSSGCVRRSGRATCT